MSRPISSARVSAGPRESVLTRHTPASGVGSSSESEPGRTIDCVANGSAIARIAASAGKKRVTRRSFSGVTAFGSTARSTGAPVRKRKTRGIQGMRMTALSTASMPDRVLTGTSYVMLSSQTENPAATPPSAPSAAVRRHKSSSPTSTSMAPAANWIVGE